MKKIIITASDEKYMDLTWGLLKSLNKIENPSWDIGILDAGLSEKTKKEITPFVTHIINADWDFNIRDEIKENKPYLKANYSRLMLKKYFPDYDLYLWLDADIWVQERFAIDWFFKAAEKRSIGISPSVDVSYKRLPSQVQWRLNNLFQYFGQEALELYKTETYYCSGAFSLHKDAPHWDAWEKYVSLALQKSPFLACDQSILNFMLWKENFPVYPLPAICNWLCQQSIPHINLQDGKLREPYLPHRLIGIVHLAGRSKNIKLTANTSSGKKEFNLTYKENGFIF